MKMCKAMATPMESRMRAMIVPTVDSSHGPSKLETHFAKG